MTPAETAYVRKSVDRTLKGETDLTLEYVKVLVKAASGRRF